MKKSDMVIEITKVIETYRNTTPNFQALELLSKIEELGMLPPEANFKGNNTDCLCTMRESCPSCGGKCNRWEFED